MLGGPKDTQLCKTSSSTAFTKSIPIHLILVKVYYFISLHIFGICVIDFLTLCAYVGVQ